MTTPRKRVPSRVRTAAAVATLVAALAPAAAHAAVSPMKADLETGDFSQFTQTNATNGTLTDVTDRAYDGKYAAHATFAGNAVNGFSRGIDYVNWNEGDDVWYGSAFYLPVGFKAAMQGEVSLMRWDNWPTYGTPGPGDIGGIAIWGSDKRARLKMGTYASESTLVGPFDLPEGRWFWLEVHQKLSGSGGSALSEVYLDGQKIGSSTAANTGGRYPIERVRYGIVAVAGSSQTNPLDLWFDRSTVSTGVLGPLSASSSTAGSTAGSTGGTTATAPSPTPTPTPATPPPPPPNAAPTVQLTSPTDGGTVGKSVTMGATASDDKAVKKVEFYLDGKLVNTDTAASWSYSTNTKRLSAGSHTATAKAYDAEGLSASSSVTFKK